MIPLHLIQPLTQVKGSCDFISSQGFYYLRIKEHGGTSKIHRLRSITKDGVAGPVEPFDPKTLKIAERRASSKNAWREGLKIQDIATLFNISTATATTDVNHNP